MLRNAETVAQRRSEQARARGGADQRERRQIELDRARAGTFADHDVELEVLERRIQHLFDDRAQTMDLIDEQHVVRLEIRQQRREIAGPFEHGTRGLPQVHAELVRDDVCERGLAEPRRAEQQRVVERFAALTRRRDEDLELRLDPRLTDVLREPPRTYGAIERFVVVARERRYDAAFVDAVRFVHRSAPRSRCTRRSASRIISSVLRRTASRSFSMRTTSAGL